MSFKHKLSRRLALLFSVTALAIFACELPVSTPSTTDVAQLIISPKTATVQPDQDVMFTSVALTAAGDSADVTVIWSTTGGTISGTGTNGKRHYGHWRNSACGDFQVTATGIPGNKSDVASVTVTCAVPVASVTVSPGTASVGAGATVQLTATPKDANGTPLVGRAVTWVSSNPTVATVSAAGLVTGQVAGTATITAASEGQSGTAAITVTPPAPVPVATVSVSPAAASIPAQGTVQLTATPKDANGTPLVGRAVTWASSNPSVATVSAAGLVTGQVAGTATITAASEGQSGTAAITVTAPAPPGVISQTLLTAGNNPVNGSVCTTASIAPAANTLITVAVLGHSAASAPASPTLTGGGMAAWDQVASITFDGVATPHKRLTVYRALSAAPGSGPLTITFSGAVSNCQWIVSQWGGVDVTGVNGAGAIVQTGTTAGDAVNGLSVAVAPFASADNVAYGVFGVSSSGLAITPGAGFTTIAEQPSGESPAADLAAVWGVNSTPTASWSALNGGAVGLELRAANTGPPAPVASVTVSPASGTVAVGATLQLTATPKDANGTPLVGRAVTWGSSNPSVATVSASGLVTGVTGGSATITATSEGQSGTAAITVPTTVPVATVEVTPATASVDEGKTVPLTATPKDANGTPLTGRTVTWASSNPSVATVSAAGLVTGKVAGTATITATSEGQSGSAAITVVHVPVASVTVAPATASVDEGKTVPLTATPKDANGGTLTGRTVTWASSNTSVATVSAAGLVTGKVAGTATITATSEGQSGSATITVVHVPVASVTVSPAAASADVGSTVQLTATPKDANGAPLTGRTVTWGSSNTSVATVSASGLVTGAAVGTATITATSEGKSGTAAITVVTPGASVVFVGAGDIADCGSSSDEATAALLDNIAGTVFTLGDNVYPDGTATQFTQCYDPSWGRHKARTRPSPGNHDYHTTGASGYYGYFGSIAGPSGQGYYSYDLGAWHIISLNSNVSMAAGSAQETWLRQDLAASTKQCTLAYWHHPRFSSGTKHGSTSAAQPLWQALYDNNADIVLSGHEHNYERFAPQTPTGVADPTRGIREFVVGTGGASNYTGSSPLPTSELFNGTTYGVLKLTLSAGSYTWQFIPVAGANFTDSGSGTCH